VDGVIDAEMLQGFAAGDDAAFEEVVRRFSGPMFAVAMATLGNRELAADAVQQALVAAWRASASFSPDSELAPWLYTITRRCAIDVWRRDRRHRGSDLSAASGVVDTIPGPTYETVWEAWQVRLALDRLPAEEREVIRLHYLEGLTQTEIALSLDIPLGTVKSRAYRAHHHLQPLLAHLADVEIREGAG